MAIEFSTWLYAIAVVGGSFLAGLAVDALLVSVLLRNAAPEARRQRALGRALRGQPEVWVVLLGMVVFKPLAFLPPVGDMWLSRVLTITAVVLITTFCARLAGSMLHAYLRQDSVFAPSGTIFVNLARLVVWAIGLTFILGALNVDAGPLVASLGVMGLAISLGLQDTLANFFAGLQMTLSRQIQPGDYIRLASGEEGTVHDVTWRNTTVNAPDGGLMIVPNAVIAKALITNFTSVDQTHTSVISFAVAYGSDLEHIKRLAEKSARDVRDRAESAVKDFEPTCRFTELRADGVGGTVTIRVERYQDRFPVIDELVTHLHEQLIGAGVALGTIALAAEAD